MRRPKRTLDGIENSSKTRTTLRLKIILKNCSSMKLAKKRRHIPLHRRKPRKMKESLAGFNHKASLDPRSRVKGESLSSAAYIVSFLFSELDIPGHHVSDHSCTWAHSKMLKSCLKVLLASFKRAPTHMRFLLATSGNNTNLSCTRSRSNQPKQRLFVAVTRVSADMSISFQRIFKITGSATITLLWRLVLVRTSRATKMPLFLPAEHRYMLAFSSSTKVLVAWKTLGRKKM